MIIEENKWAKDALFRLYVISKIVGHSSIKGTLEYIDNGNKIWGEIEKAINKEADNILETQVV